MDERFLNEAVAAARAAGKVQRDALGGPLDVDAALDHDIKLRLDRDCQDLITEHLLKAFPDHTVFGEEGGSPLGASEYQWIVDPIDGTVNFFYGFPHFCVAIALQHKGETILGVTLDPNRDELFTAWRGQGAFCNGRRLSVSSRTQLKEAMVSTGFSKSNETLEQSIELTKYYGLNARKLRMNGSAALDLAYVASGRLDIYLERTINLWDVAGGVLFIQEAGGHVDLSPLPNGKGYSLIASNGKVPVRAW
ncbi:MAG: inositol monophosphatase family protein [Verrucomicrobium sp.]|nr:inositol monophosphatase family protein [Verrucomicrobium sp.]